MERDADQELPDGTKPPENQSTEASEETSTDGVNTTSAYTEPSLDELLNGLCKLPPELRDFIIEYSGIFSRLRDLLLDLIPLEE